MKAIKLNLIVMKHVIKIVMFTVIFIICISIGCIMWLWDFKNDRILQFGVWLDGQTNWTDLADIDFK